MLSFWEIPKPKDGGKTACNFHKIAIEFLVNITRRALPGNPNIYFRTLLSSTLFFPLLLSAQITDAHIPRSIAQYFRINRLGPELVSVDVFEHPKSGRVLKIQVAARRTQSEKDLAFALAAASAVANLADQEIELFWVDMEIRFKEVETTTVLAPAKCTIDAIIYRMGTESWWDDCLEFIWVQ